MDKNFNLSLIYNNISINNIFIHYINLRWYYLISNYFKLICLKRINKRNYNIYGNMEELLWKNLKERH